MAGLFDPTSFGGPEAGLFDRLRAMAQFQPGGALPGQPGSQDLASVVPQIPQQQAAPGPGQQQPPGALDQIGQSMSGLGPALMAFAGGTLSGGIGHGLSAMAPALQQRDQQSMQLRAMGMSYQALRARGMSDSDARLAILNPEILKSYAGNFGPDTNTVVPIKNPNTGIESSAVLGSRSGSLTPAIPVPGAAVARLRANLNNPQAFQDFESVFGPGSARRALGAGAY